MAGPDPLGERAGVDRVVADEEMDQEVEVGRSGRVWAAGRHLPRNRGGAADGFGPGGDRRDGTPEDLPGAEAASGMIEKGRVVGHRAHGWLLPRLSPSLGSASGRS